MKLFKISLILMMSLSFFGQSVDDLLENLPADVRDSLVQQASIETRNQEIIVEDNITNKTSLTNEVSDDAPFFGYNFFESNSQTSTPIVDIPLQSDYIISFNDDLELLLTGVLEKTIKLRVDLSGTVLIPELGPVSLGNMKLSDADKKIKTLVAESYVGVESSLSVLKPSLKKISVLGAVKRPGTYLVNPFISVSEAIKYAGGLTDYSSLRNIEIKSSNGSLTKVDLYDFLIFGERQNDINIQNGDSIMVSASSNFVNVSGEVLRPNLYEYKNNETIADLVQFTLGTTNSANLENISIFYVENAKQLSKKVVLEDSIQDTVLTELNIGRLISVPEREARVFGPSVETGSYSVKKGENASDLIKKLKFSGDVFPYYFLLKQTDKNNLVQENYNLSLSDPDTYKNIVLKDNVEITFYSRFDFISDEEQTEQQRLLREQIPNTIFKYIIIGLKSFSVPIAGNFVPEEIINYIGENENLNFSETIVKTTEALEKNSFKTKFDAVDVVSLTIPSRKVESFTVEIRGQVNAPGTYIVDSSSTLSELYDMAGGLKESAFNNGIIVQRESVREAQKNALDSAKKMLYDSLLSNTSIPDTDVRPVDYSSLISLAEAGEVTGRISGNFGFGSEGALQLTLEENDYVYVPFRPTTISIYGEVLNPLTIGFNSRLNYQDYVKLAGGFTKNADKASVYVIKANGESFPLNSGSFFRRQINLDPGDTIVIPRDTEKISTLPLVSIATKIISDIAFAAASLNAISN